MMLGRRECEGGELCRLLVVLIGFLGSPTTAQAVPIATAYAATGDVSGSGSIGSALMDVEGITSAFALASGVRKNRASASASADIFSGTVALGFTVDSQEIHPSQPYGNGAEVRASLSNWLTPLSSLTATVTLEKRTDYSGPAFFSPQGPHGGLGIAECLNADCSSTGQDITGSQGGVTFFDNGIETTTFDVALEGGKTYLYALRAQYSAGSLFGLPSADIDFDGSVTVSFSTGANEGLFPDEPLLPISADPVTPGAGVPDSTLLPGEPGFDFVFPGSGPGELRWVDPVVAIGYDYVVTSGPKVHSVLLPLGVGDGLFDLYLYDEGSGSWIDSGEDLVEGELYEFAAGGVDRFRILGIEVDAGLDPADATAFVTGLTFDGTAETALVMQPISATVVPLPPAFLLLLPALLGLSLLGRPGPRGPRLGSAHLPGTVEAQRGQLVPRGTAS